MTILQLNKFYFLKGGAERYVFQLSHELEKRGHTVIPFAMQHPKNVTTSWSRFFPSFVETENVSFGLRGLKTLIRMLWSREAARGLSRLLDEVHIDVAHVHNVYTQLSPSVLSVLKQRGIPIVMTVHDHHLVSPEYAPRLSSAHTEVSELGLLAAARSRFHKNSFPASFLQAAVFHLHRVLRVYQKSIDHFLTPALFLKEKLLAAGFSESNIEVLPFGIDASALRAPAQDDERFILFVGRISSEKGVETLLALARRLPDIRFVLVGVGPLESVLRKASQDLPNVEWKGFLDGEALAQMYRGARAVVIPSRVVEVFPFVVLEAMAAGKAIVASRAGGLVEMIQEGETGYLVDADDLDGFVSRVRALCEDPGLAQLFGKTARAQVEQHYDLKAHIDRVEEVYRLLRSDHPIP